MLVTPTTNEGLKENLYQMFAFYIPNWRFHPKVRKGFWDGKIRLYDKNTCRLYIGLYKQLIEKLKELNITYETDGKVENVNDGPKLSDIEKYLDSMSLDMTPWQHQIDMFKAAIHLKRLVAISPTASGKSFAYYLYIKYLIEKELHISEKILLIVPTISLVLQMQSDFIEYDKKYKTIQNKIHTIMAGDDKNADKQIYISTWQSIYDLGIDYFSQFTVMIMDEFHMVKAQSLTVICEKMVNAEWRLGATGTLDEWKTHHIVMEGLVGKIYRITKTSTLIDKGILSPLKIYNYIFEYPKQECELFNAMRGAQGNKQLAYQMEIKYVYNHKKRNNGVCKLVSLLKQNSLVLFTRIEHGKMLHKRISELTKGINKVFYIDGSTSAEEREDIRAQFERDSNCIGVASVQVFGVGINIKNVHNIILVAGGKSKIRILQAIGRGLRKHTSKINLNVIDIIDDLRFGKKSNFLYLHFKHRLKFYEDEKFLFIHKNIQM